MPANPPQSLAGVRPGRTAWEVGETAAAGKPALGKFGCASVRRPVSEGRAVAEMLAAFGEGEGR